MAAGGAQQVLECHDVPLGEVEAALARQLHEARGAGEAPLQRACMSTLVIYCDETKTAERLPDDIALIVAMHPARVLLLLSEPSPGSAELTASLRVWSHSMHGGRALWSEQVTLQARGHGVEDLPFAVRELLIGDLPTNLWWASTVPPPLAGPLLFDLAEYAEQIVYDSLGWKNPQQGVAATAAWLAKLKGTDRRWRVASDLNWRRLKYWRRVLAQALDTTSLPGALETVREVLIEHGPRAVTQAWQLGSWLACRLGWQVRAGSIQPGTEMAWQVEAARGMIRLRFRRLSEGPSEVRHVQVACAPGGTTVSVDISVEDERRLAVRLGQADTAPRTVTIQTQSVPEMLARQLSDREPDPIFRESMAVAHVLAQGLLGEGQEER
jgi:glucose-6-phosphate dehydrogenase assembly protein OpcA